MKKIFAWLIVSVLLLSCILTGCDGKNDGVNGTSNNIEANDIFGEGGSETEADSETEAGSETVDEDTSAE